MKKGIVLEVHDEYVTMLTPEGEFLKSRKQMGQIKIGEEVHFFPMQTDEINRGRHAALFQRRWAIISVLTAIILIFSLYPKYINNQVYAYVSLDVNPSLELGVNKKMQVVSIDAYNEEGASLLEDLGDWKKKRLTDVSAQIFKLFQEKGYLKTNSDVIIASVLAKEDNRKLKEKMEHEIAVISETIEEKDIHVTTVEVTNESRGEAIKQGVSPGKYIQNLHESEMAENENTSINDVKSMEEPPSLASGLENVKNKNENNLERKANKSEKREKSIQEKSEKRVQEKSENRKINIQEKSEKKEKNEQIKIEKNDRREQIKTEKKQQQGQSKQEKKKQHESTKTEEKVNHDQSNQKKQMIQGSKKQKQERQNQIQYNKNVRPTKNK